MAFQHDHGKAARRNQTEKSVFETVMSKESLYLFDTTLRDGAQTTGVDFSLEDKRRLMRVLDDLGVDYIEGGYPGANTTDTELFSSRPAFKSARFTAFGMTKRS